MSVEQVGPGGVSNSYGVRGTSAKQEYDNDKEYKEVFVPKDTIPVTATVSSSGELVIDAAISQLPGEIPLDVPHYMFYRPVGQEIGITVPNPYDGYKDDAVVHPSLEYVPGGFAGYKYWLAYTPYPNSESAYENPCTVVSNKIDGDYVVAPGTTNPLDYAVAPAYNRDTHIYYDKSASRMVLIWNRFGFPASNKTTIFMSVHDGSGWSNPVSIYTGTVLLTDIVSPSIWFNSASAKWEIVGVNPDTANRELMKITSDELLSGWTQTAVNLPMTLPAGRKPWHPCLRRLSSGRIIGLLHDSLAPGQGGYINLMMSKDGASFEMAPIKIESDQGRTSGRWYRSTMVAIERNSAVEIYGMYSVVGSSKFFLQKLEPFSVNNNKGKETARIGSMLAIARSGGASGLLSVDDFNRADNAAGLGTDLLGKTWTNVYPSNVIGVKNGRAYNVTTGNCLATVETGTTSYSASVIFSTPGSEGYLVVRKSATEFWRFGVISSTLVQLQRFNSAVDISPLADMGNMRPIAKPGDIFRIDVSGCSAQFFLNGKLIYVADGTVFPNTRSVGLQASGASETNFANFVVQATSDL